MASFFSVLEDAAGELPDKRLFVFPETRSRSHIQLTYSELAEQAAAAGRAIADAAKPGDRALLLFPTGPDFWASFMGCLRQGIIAVPLHIPNVNRTSEMLQAVCNDCRPAVLVTDLSTAELLNRRSDRHPYLSGITIISPEFWKSDNHPAQSAVSAPRASELALIQYTSGSTSRPKGVQISHRNLISNLQMISLQMEIRTNEDSGVTWLPHYHDMGLIGGYLATLYSRNTTLCLPPDEFAIRPVRWLELISESGATVCGGPNFAYQICSEKVTEEQISELDLSSWRVAYVGAERIRPHTISVFVEKFSRAGFRENSFFPCYGLGEATLMVTGGPAEASPVFRDLSRSALADHQVQAPADVTDVTRLCGSGQTIDGTLVSVLSTVTGKTLPECQVGEICISGPAVSRGYWGQSEQDPDMFLTVQTDSGCLTMLRTGDLGFLDQGVLFITGRTRELIIIRGRNLYPEDIEYQVLTAHPALSKGAAVAFSVESNLEETLVIVAELSRSNADQMEHRNTIIAAIRQRIVESFGVNPLEILIVRPATIPHTSSGKPRRLLLKEAWVRNELS